MPIIKQEPSKIILYGGTFIALCFAFVLGSNFLQKPDEKLQVVDASDLYWQFNRNELAATTKYTGKKVFIAGIYAGNGISHGKPWILIGPGLTAADVHCYLNKNSVQKAANLKLGEKIKIQGVVGEKMFASISVNNCTL